jgi:hypothetical protein
MRKDSAARRGPQKNSERDEKKAAAAEKGRKLKRKLMRQLSF